MKTCHGCVRVTGGRRKRREGNATTEVSTPAARDARVGRGGHAGQGRSLEEVTQVNVGHTGQGRSLEEVTQVKVGDSRRSRRSR